MTVSGGDIIAFAKKYLGTPYEWGGNSLSSGVDCSGLVQQVYKKFGINVSRTTYDQIGEGKAVKMNQLQPGDMVFFDTNPKVSGPDHVGLYIGGGKFIHAPRPGSSVKISDLGDNYYAPIFMGGRRVSGIEGGGVSDWGDSGPEGNPKLAPEELAASYGWAYGFLQAIPELKKLFTSAVSETWSADMFTAKLRDTKWYQENSDVMRKATAEKTTDPATYNAKLEAAKIQIRVIAAQMGAIIPEGKLDSISESAMITGMDDALIKDTLGQYVEFVNGTLNGQAGAFERNMYDFAYQQGIDLNRDTVKTQAQLVARGIATEQDFKAQIVKQASSTYPNYAAQLEAGQTMMQIANPYIQLMSKDLELPTAQLNLKDPLIRQALNGVNKDGKPVGMDAVTFRTLIRNDPRWASTDNARNDTMTQGLKILKDMGLR